MVDHYASILTKHHTKNEDVRMRSMLSRMLSRILYGYLATLLRNDCPKTANFCFHNRFVQGQDCTPTTHSKVNHK